ncbi:hypothetical protein NE237_003890 [Protea cynaroides]|uniref:Uncharacterized protein n=1 Tax=Protea cynaroides TaxID=273540 RepID=A0A9Q0KIB1_9MAGN|nr:hypothetical protein NE237_003890 [Protea cynaroides]
MSVNAIVNNALKKIQMRTYLLPTTAPSTPVCRLRGSAATTIDDCKENKEIEYCQRTMRMMLTLEACRSLKQTMPIIEAKRCRFAENGKDVGRCSWFKMLIANMDVHEPLPCFFTKSGSTSSYKT